MFRDSDTEVDLIWYPCLPDAPVLAVPSAICSLDWNVQERSLGIYADSGIGEVAGRPRVYNGQKAKPAATGLHRCGTDEDFALGATFDPTVNRPKRADGLPVCCGELPAGFLFGGRALQAPNGGIAFGGRTPAIHVCGTGPDPGQLYDWTVDGPIVAYVSQPGVLSDRIVMPTGSSPITYRYRMWGPASLSIVNLFQGTGFPPNGWQNVFPDPTAEFFELTHAIPNVFNTIAQWSLVKTDTTQRMYIVSVEPVP